MWRKTNRVSLPSSRNHSSLRTRTERLPDELLARVGWWGRPVLAAFGAGMIIGVFRRDDLRAAVTGGAIGGLLALWGVYAIVRLSVHVLFVDRSITRVITLDLLRLAAYGAPGGAAGAAAGWGARMVTERAAGGR